MPIFWKAVGYLEGINFKVIAATADGASPNIRFFRMHTSSAEEIGKGVVYREKKEFMPKTLFILFFC